MKNKKLKAEAEQINNRLNLKEARLCKADRLSIIQKFYPNKGALNKGVVHCLNCGFDEPYLKQNFVCPNCGAKLEIEKSRKKRVTWTWGFQRFEAIGSFQVVRSFMGKASTGDHEINDATEYQRYFIAEDGTEFVFSKPKAMYFYWNGNYRMAEPITYKRWDNCDSVKAWRIKSLQPWVKQRGLTKYDKVFGGANLLYGLMKNNTFESVYKTMGGAAAAMYRDKSYCTQRDALYAAMKVANRHNSKVFSTLENANLWYDMYEALRECEKDLHSPKYLAPEDLRSAHNYWVAAAQKHRHVKWERQQAERRKQEALKDVERKASFDKRIQFFNDLCIKIGELTIKPILTVEDMVNEGEAMHNCVGTYWKRNNSLVLHALNGNGKSVATIEVNLNTFEVPQCYAACNQESPYREAITKALSGNYHIRLRYMRYQREMRKSA